ncbi:MAG TPA: NapC/NirT family cytochrome c, partial [Thermoanaerobaculia bacterium]|nr:NapC/NirT family cytochrome c [Thermoanaerobaculia bacterium]
MADTVKRSLARNLISEAGVLIAVIALANIIFLIYIDITSAENPYLGILTYVIVPSILVVGLLLFVFGLLWERRRRRRAGHDMPEYPEINMNIRRVRNIVYISIIGGVAFLLISVLGTYRAYHYTDSDQFCGATCHTPMAPEYTAYKASPHARVGCVGCHVGPGASWYVRSKLSGAYQLYAVLTNKFPRPIGTP